MVFYFVTDVCNIIQVSSGGLAVYVAKDQEVWLETKDYAGMRGQQSGYSIFSGFLLHWHAGNRKQETALPLSFISTKAFNTSQKPERSEGSYLSQGGTVLPICYCHTMFRKFCILCCIKIHIISTFPCNQYSEFLFVCILCIWGNLKDSIFCQINMTYSDYNA